MLNYQRVPTINMHQQSSINIHINVHKSDDLPSSISIHENIHKPDKKNRCFYIHVKTTWESPACWIGKLTKNAVEFTSKEWEVEQPKGKKKTRRPMKCVKVMDSTKKKT